MTFRAEGCQLLRSLAALRSIVYYRAVSRRHRHKRLPDDDLSPADPFPLIEPRVQAEHMRELRTLHNRIADGIWPSPPAWLKAVSIRSFASRPRPTNVGRTQRPPSGRRGTCRTPYLLEQDVTCSPIGVIEMSQ